MLEQINVNGWVNLIVLAGFAITIYFIFKNYSKINSFFIKSRTAARLDRDAELMQLTEVIDYMDIGQRLILLQRILGPCYTVQLHVNGDRVSISGLGEVQAGNDQEPPDYAG